jgi:chromodomain-helicase-DNA-binding protein 7
VILIFFYTCLAHYIFFYVSDRKTIQTATYVKQVATQLSKRGPFLVIAPLSTIPHWYREFTGWTDLNTIVYHGSANDRERAREDEFAFPEDRVQASNVGLRQRYLNKVAKRWRSEWEKTWMVEVVITTPEMLVTEDFRELAAVEWEILVVDEAHRLKNHKSKLAVNLRDGFDFKHCLLLTGTPIQNNMEELWTLLNFIDHKSFGDLDKFMTQYGDIKSKERVDELHESIRPYILRRLKEDVEKSVPPKEETLIEVELTVVQKQYYRALYEKNLKFLHKNKKGGIDGPSLNNLAMQLRKCCNHPFLLNGIEEEIRNQQPNVDIADLMVNTSGKFVLLDKLLPRLKDEGHRILIFSQFKIMLDIIEDYLNHREFRCERIDGSITGLKRQAAIDRFQSKDSKGRDEPFIMLLSTRAGGVGINLTAADTCVSISASF